MDDKELQKLKSFGNNFEKSIKRNNNNSNSNNFNNRNKDKSVVIKSPKINIFVLLKKILLFIRKNIKFLFIIFRNKFYSMKYKNQISNYKISSNLKNSNKVISGYRIIETCKQKGNKTIIVRKRVLVPIDKQLLNPVRNDLGSLFYITFKDDSFKNFKTEAYSRLKKSVWDFPLKKQK